MRGQTVAWLAGRVGPGARAGQGLLHLPADQLVQAGQGQVQGAHLRAPGAGPAQGLLGGAGQGRLRPGHQLQAVEGEPPSPPPPLKGQNSAQGPSCPSSPAYVGSGQREARAHHDLLVGHS